MNKNHIVIVLVGIIFLGLIISNLYFIKETFDLNEQLSRIYEFEAQISNLKAVHQQEINDLKNDYEEQINEISSQYTEKFDTVKKALNAFEYEIEEFYKNKHILEEDYLENRKKIDEVRKDLESKN